MAACSPTLHDAFNLLPRLSPLEPPFLHMSLARSLEQRSSPCPLVWTLSKGTSLQNLSSLMLSVIDRLALETDKMEERPSRRYPTPERVSHKTNSHKIDFQIEIIQEIYFQQHQSLNKEQQLTSLASDRPSLNKLI